MDHIYEAERVSHTILTMIHCARIIGLPIIANTQYKKGLGVYIPELESEMEAIPRPDKVDFNAVADPETRSLVSRLSPEINTAILVGVETHICIYQTATGLQDMGIQPWIVADGVSSRSNENYQLGLMRLRDIGASVGPAEMILYELLAKAGTAQFKAVLPHIL